MSLRKAKEALGEIPKGAVTRKNHGGTAYPTAGPTTTKSSIKEVLRKNKELKDSIKAEKNKLNKN